MVTENEFFRQTTLRISSSLNIETAMRRCMAFLSQHIPVSGMLFGVYDPERNAGKILAAIWPPNMARPPETLPFPTAFWNWMKGKWAGEPATMFINDLEREEGPTSQILLSMFPPEISLLFMDLELEEKRLGNVVFFAEGKHRYEATHARLLSLVHEPFAIDLSNILRHQEILRLKDMLADDNRFLNRQIMEMTGDTIIGADFGLRDVMKMVHQVAPLSSPVLLMGETGSGKEVIANAIHFSSIRSNNPYIRVNCGAIP
jgi:hypothetical protein